MVSLEDVHNCEKCRGKIVCISVDYFGIARCGYCNDIVNYKPYYDKVYKQEMLKKIEEFKLKREESKWQKKKNLKKMKRKKIRRK